MKALLEARQILYSYNHSMADLLGTLRHFHPKMRDFRLSIPPDIYTAYAGRLGYRARRQPRLTDQPDYLEKTVADASSSSTWPKPPEKKPAKTNCPNREPNTLNMEARKCQSKGPR